MINYLKYICILIASFAFSQQNEGRQFLYTKKVDSLILSTVHYYDRTIPTPTKYIKNIKDSITGMVYELETSKRDTIFITKHKKLNFKEILKLNKILESKKTYDGGAPLLGMYDIQFDYYLKGNIIQTITISSYTKKIVISKTGCKSYLDNYGNEIDPCLYRDRISNSVIVFFEKLLKNKKLWRKDMFFFINMKF